MSDETWKFTLPPGRYRISGEMLGSDGDRRTFVRVATAEEAARLDELYRHKAEQQPTTDEELVFLRSQLAGLETARDQLRAAKRLLVEASAFMRIFAQDAWIEEAAELVGPLTEQRKGRR